MTDYHMHFSIIAEPLENQLNKQGYTLGENPERYDTMLKHIFALHMNSILTQGETDRALQRYNKFIRKIAKEIEQ
jgi:flagellar biosynthesis component FlhA